MKVLLFFWGLSFFVLLFGNVKGKLLFNLMNGFEGIFFCLLNICSNCWICVCIFLFFKSFKFWWWILFLLSIFLGEVMCLKLFWSCMLWLCGCYLSVVEGWFIKVGIKGFILEFEVGSLFWGGLRVNFIILGLVFIVRFLEEFVRMGWWFVLMLLFFCRIGFIMLLFCSRLVVLEYDCVIIFCWFCLNVLDFVFLLFVWLFIYRVN